MKGIRRRFFTLPEVRIFVAASILAPVIWGAIDFLPTFSTDAAATSVCYDAYKYAGYVTTYFHNQGVYGDINYSSGDMELYDDLTDHGAIWIGRNPFVQPRRLERHRAGDVAKPRNPAWRIDLAEERNGPEYEQ